MPEEMVAVTYLTIPASVDVRLEQIAEKTGVKKIDHIRMAIAEYVGRASFAELDREQIQKLAKALREGVPNYHPGADAD